MNDIDDREIERRLRTVPTAPIPEGLRDRVLASARSYRTPRAWTTSRQRLWLATGAALLLLVFAADAFVSRAQRSRLVALSGSTRPVPPRSAEQNGLLAEVLGGVVVSRLEAAALGGPEPRGAKARRGPEPRVRLTSSLSENLENELLLEESHDSPKNLH